MKQYNKKTYLVSRWAATNLFCRFRARGGTKEAKHKAHEVTTTQENKITKGKTQNKQRRQT
jgi:hypothetical protein